MPDKIFLSIDYGLRRIGLATSDPTCLIATPLRTIAYKTLKNALKEILLEIERQKVSGVVVGYPLAPDGGHKGERCAMVDDFIARLEKVYSGPIYRMDERDSSAEAAEIVHRHGKKIGRDKEKIDRLAAAIILQRFLDEHKYTK